MEPASDPIRVLDDSAVETPTTEPDAGAGRPASGRPIPDDALIVLPVRNLVVFPSTVLPIGSR